METFALYIFVSFIFYYLAFFSFTDFFKLTIKPNFVFRDGIFVAKTNIGYHLATLFLHKKTVTFNTVTNILTIRDVFLFIFIFEKHIHRQEIKSLRYKYIRHFTTDRSFPPFEEFPIYLKLINDVETKLFSFIGREGIGTQEFASKAYFEQLMDYTGKKIA